MIGLNYTIEPIPEMDYTFDLIFNTLGIPFMKNINLTKVDPKIVPLVITYGQCFPNNEFYLYLEKGGYIINIPYYENILGSRQELLNEGYSYSEPKSSRIFGYLESNKILDIIYHFSEGSNFIFLKRNI